MANSYKNNYIAVVKASATAQKDVLRDTNGTAIEGTTGQGVLDQANEQYPDWQDFIQVFQEVEHTATDTIDVV